MRVLVDNAGAGVSTDLDDEGVRLLYRSPQQPWWRTNMVSTLDGAATGESGLSGSINNDADHAVFHALRAIADVVVVGAGTARAEGYRPTHVPIVLVSNSAAVPEKLQGAEPGQVIMVTTAHAPQLSAAEDLLGPAYVWVLGQHAVDLPALKQRLDGHGWGEILSEGGPAFLGDGIRAGVVDELCVTYAPLTVAGEHRRIVTGAPLTTDWQLHTLLEAEGTLLARYVR